MYFVIHCIYITGSKFLLAVSLLNEDKRVTTVTRHYIFNKESVAGRLFQSFMCINDCDLAHS